MGNHSTRSDLEGGRRSRAARSAETPGRFRTNRRWGQVGSRAGIPVMSGTAFEPATASAPPALGKMTTKPGMGGYSRFRGLSRLDSLRKLVEDVGRAMHPAALLGRLQPDFTQGLPKAQRALADRESRRFEAPAVQSTVSPLSVLSRSPSSPATRSFLPSSRAPIRTSVHSRSSSRRMRKCTPSAKRYTRIASRRGSACGTARSWAASSPSGG
jgi:hypothetical protein